MKKAFARADKNQPAVVKVLRKAGFTVHHTFRLGRGFPDLCVSKDGLCALVEIKDGSKPPSAQRLTPDELKFFREFDGPVFKAATGDEAVRKMATFLGMTDEERADICRRRRATLLATMQAGL